jgi:hypothetical protein
LPALALVHEAEKMGKKWVMAFCLSAAFVSFTFSIESKTIFELEASDTVSREDIYEMFYLRSMSYLRSAKYYWVAYKVFLIDDLLRYPGSLMISEVYTDSGDYTYTVIAYFFNSSYVGIYISDNEFSFLGKDAKRIITFREGTAGRREICEDINWALTAAKKESDLAARMGGYVSNMVITTLFE